MKTKLLVLSFVLLAVLPVVAQTNTVVTNPVVTVALPVVERVETWLTTFQNILAGVATAVAAILAVIAKIKTTQASVVPTLIRQIEEHDSDELKAAIKADAIDKGVEGALNKAVREQTTSSTTPPAGVTVDKP